MGKQRILIVEDAEDVARLLERGLVEEGFEVAVAPDGGTALRKLSDTWGLVILDLNLPDLPGENILMFLSQRIDRPPVLVLTARSGIQDKVTLFRHGCDDYLTKPFAFEELLERVRALLRRAPQAAPDECEYEGLRLKSATHQVEVGEIIVSLTPKEFAICRQLLREPGRVVSRRELLHSVWGLNHEPKTNFIEVHLANLRRKLSQVERDSWLQTVRTTGFFFARPTETSEA